MKHAKAALVGIFLYISTLLGGCLASAPPSLGDPPAAPSPVLAAAVLPYIGANGRCSAVAIEPHILSTARHCIRALGDGYILGPHGSLFQVVEGWASKSDDVALLKVEEVLPVASPVAVLLPRVGDLAYFAGYGCDTTADHFSLGVRTASYDGRDSWGTFWFRGSACHGDSGGGAFDGEGALIGVLVQVNTDDGPVTRVGVEPLAGVLDGLASTRDWKPAAELLTD